jgi:hypothetical protein
MLTADIIPIQDKNVVALKLQEQGFDILSIGETITIEGSPEKFESFFNMKMEKTSKSALPGVNDSTKLEYYRPIVPPSIPEEFRSLIKEVFFPEPPEYF